MILIADSGSTKTEWCVAVEGKLVERIFTEGMNPYFQSGEEMSREIGRSLLPAIRDYAIDTIYFYGAGCASAEKNKLVSDALFVHFPIHIYICSDLTGAARALCGSEPGIACILGTGSNSCWYDGHDIRANLSPLGYILGDEGSGAVLGKRLVGDCLKKQLPPQLVEQFMETYELTPALVLERVYRQPFPNRWLASLSRFLADHIDEPSLHELVYDSFRSFFIRNVMTYEGYERYPISFTGSVAFYYRDILREAAQSLSLSIQKIEQTPMPGLLAYHSRRE